jgi:hypothetical protein
MRIILTFVIATICSIVLVDSTAEACSCASPTIEGSFDNNTDVVIVQINGRRSTDEELIYRATVRRRAKGCTERGERILLSTAASSATCGVTNMRPGRSYLIFGDESYDWRGRTVLDIDLCDYNKPLRELTRADYGFLRRNIEECGASEPTCDAYEVDEFGMCDMVLGYGIQAETDRCGAISGCSLPDDVVLFESNDECQRECMED